LAKREGSWGKLTRRAGCIESGWQEGTKRKGSGEGSFGRMMGERELLEMTKGKIGVLEAGKRGKIYIVRILGSPPAK